MPPTTRRQRPVGLAIGLAFVGSLFAPSLALAAAPIAVADAYDMNEDDVLTTSAVAGVLNNDSDPDVSDTLTVVLDTDVTNGTLVLAGDGSFTYTPDADFNGSDTFDYHATDGVAPSNTVTVTITVDPVNDAPVAAGDSYSVSEDSTLTVNTASGVLENDSDVEGDPLTAIIATGVSHGTLSLNANGSFTYTPTANYSGSDSFTYRATDGSAASNIATVSLTINGLNDPPTATADSYSASEDVPLVMPNPGVLVNDVDIDPGTSLTAELVSGPTNGASLDLRPGGGFTFTPAANWSGTSTFTYHATDGYVDSNTVTVTITVAAVNDPPATTPDSYSTSEDTQLNRNTFSVGLLANDSDLEGNTPLTATVAGQPSHGALTSFGTNGTFRYLPAANYSGMDSFTYRATDSLGAQSGPTTVTITVNPVNDAPVAVADTGSTSEDTPLVVVGPGVLINDTDIDSASLTASLVTGPTHGSLTLNANGGYTYAPSANYTGPDGFSYRANDGALNSNTVTVTLTVTPVDDPPVAAADARSTNEDTVLNAATVLGNDSDPDGDPLTAILDTPPTSGTLDFNTNGTFTYTPSQNASGAVTFTYHANDGVASSSSATVTVTINAVNDAPVAVADSATATEDTALSTAPPGLKANDTDVDTASSGLTTSIWTQATHGTASVNSNGSWSYMPNANYNGPDSFTYRVSDDALSSAPATVSLTVTAVNDAPVASSDAYAPTEDAPLIVLASNGILVDDSDIDSVGLTAVLASGPSHGSVTLQTSGAFTYTPAADYNGSDTFTYRASDGLLQSSPTTVTLTIAAVNDPPTFTLDLDPAVAVEEDCGAGTCAALVSIPAFLTGLNAGPTNEGGQIATVVSVVAANPALFATQPAIGSNGTLTFKPGLNRNGTSDVTVTASDDGGTLAGGVDSTSETFPITIVPENDTVFANSDSWMLDDTPAAWVEAGTTTTLDVLSNDVTLDPGEALTIASVTKPGHGTVTVAADRGSVSYRPAAGFIGSDSFSYRMTDGVFLSNSAAVHVSVADRLPPVLGAMSARFVTGAKLSSKVTIKLSWSASDPGSGVKSYDIQQSTNGGASWTTIYSGTTGSSAQRSVGFNTTYSYRFRARDKGNRLSAWSTPVTFTPRRLQESTTQATYSSGWRSASISSASGDHTRYSKTHNATSSFTFTGRAVSLVAPRSAKRGKAEIRVDGVLVATVNLYRSKTDAQHHVWQRSWSAVGPHVVTVRVLGTSGHPRFDVDAWTVLQ